MKLTIQNTKGKKVKVRDAMGRYIPLAFSYDTKTKMTGLYLYASLKGKKGVVTANKNGKGFVVKVKVVIPGSYAEINGKVVS